MAHYVRSLSGESHDSEAAEVSARHFAKDCAACHGSDGKGNPAFGAPDLSDKASLYGNSVDHLISTISHGRSGQMPAWKERLSLAEIHLITAWLHKSASQNTP